MSEHAEYVDPLDDQALETLLEYVNTEINRRTVLNTAEATLRELNQTVLHASGVPFGGAWQQPAGAHNAYPEGWEVAHDGKAWVSLVNANTWEPGVSAWREKVPEGQVPEWVQPTGGHDAYRMGDRVTFQGEVWESLRDGNVWSPTALPSGWRKVE